MWVYDAISAVQDLGYAFDGYGNLTSREDFVRDVYGADRTLTWTSFQKPRMVAEGRCLLRKWRHPTKTIPNEVAIL